MAWWWRCRSGGLLSCEYHWNDKKMLLWPQFCDSYQSYLNSLWTGMGHVRCFCPSNRLIILTWLSNSVIFTFSRSTILPGRQWISVIPSLSGRSSFLPSGTETTAGMWSVYWRHSEFCWTTVTVALKCSYTCKTTYGLYSLYWCVTTAGALGFIWQGLKPFRNHPGPFTGTVRLGPWGFRAADWEQDVMLWEISKTILSLILPQDAFSSRS